MFLIAGLGNPTEKYSKTRHNAGFDTLDRLGKEWGIRLKEQKFKALTGTGVVNGQKVLLVKPQTFMNLSGESLREAVAYYHLDPETQLIVIYDDIALEPGQIRIRERGSAGGHNGIKSIISCLGTQNFMRIRIGVGEKPSGFDLADYVLGRLSFEDRVAMEEAMDYAIEAAGLMIQNKSNEAMNRFNSKHKEVDKEQ